LSFILYTGVRCGVMGQGSQGSGTVELTP